MPSIVSSSKGHTYTSSFEAKTQPDQVESSIRLLEAESTPLITEIQTVAGKDSVKNSTFYHHEDELVPDSITVTATESSGDGHIVAGNDYVYIQQYDVLINTRTKHIIEIDDATIDTGELTCHDVGGTDLGTTIGDVFRRIGNAFSEGGTAPDPLMTVEVLKTWYLQKIRRTIEVTREAENVQVTYGSRRAHELRKKTAQIKREMELAGFLGGGGTSDTGAGPPVTNMTVPASAGLYHTITTNVELNQGMLTLGALRDICDGPRKYHPSGKFTLYCGPTVRGIIDDLVAGKIQVQNGATEYGVDISTLRLGPNKIRLVEQPLFDDEYLGRLMFIVPDPISKFVRLAGLMGYPISWYKDIKTDDGNDTIKDEIKGWFGYRFIEEPRFALVDGITG